MSPCPPNAAAPLPAPTGKKSHGPVTPEGKARSAANSTRHTLASSDRTAHTVCLGNENRAEFTQLHQALIAGLAPATGIEDLIVQEMAVARWRLQRAWAMETSLLDNQMDHMTGEVALAYESNADEPTRAALAFRRLNDNSASFPVLLRYESRLSRQFERCRKQLAEVRANPPENIEIPNEPNPTNEHSEPEPQNDPQFPDRSMRAPHPASDREPEPVIAQAQSAPEVGGIPPPARPDDSGPPSGPPPALPRAA